MLKTKLIGEMKLMELTSELMLRTGSKMKEVSLAYDNGSLYADIRFRKGSKKMKASFLMDLDDIQDLNSNELYEIMWNECQLRGREKVSPKVREQRKLKHVIKTGVIDNVSI